MWSRVGLVVVEADVSGMSGIDLVGPRLMPV